MRVLVVAGLALALSGCVVERLGPPGVTLTRPVSVKPRDVVVFANTAAVPGRFSVVEEIWVRDNGEDSPEEMEDRLRTRAGALGANAIVLHPLNRRDNGTRIDLRPTLDDPFEYFQATAVWLGEGAPPQIYLGKIG